MASPVGLSKVWKMFGCLERVWESLKNIGKRFVGLVGSEHILGMFYRIPVEHSHLSKLVYPPPVYNSAFFNDSIEQVWKKFGMEAGGKQSLENSLETIWNKFGKSLEKV